MQSSTQIDRYPAPWRVALAFVVAPLFGAVVLSILQLGWPSSPWKLIASMWLLSLGAFPAAALLGLPAYFLLRNLTELSLFSCAVVGAFIAVAPGFLLALLPMSEHFQFSVGERAIVVDGQPTAWGWALWRANMAKTAVAGAAGGVLFWAVARYRFTDSKSA
ncbi:hypothetical protein ACWIGM_09940 [Bosea sp. NPDC055332]